MVLSSTNVMIFAFTLMVPFEEYFTEFDSKLRRTCYNLRLSNFANFGTRSFVPFAKMMMMFLATSVEFISSIISLIESSKEPVVKWGTKLPFSMIR